MKIKMPGIASFLLLAWATSVHAHPICDPPLGPLQKLAVLSNQTTCDAVTLSQAQKEFKTRFPDDRVLEEKNVEGIKLQGSDDEIKFARLVIAGGGSSAKDRLPKSWPEIAKGCTTVVCGLGKLFGNEESALRVLNVAARTGYVISATQEGNPIGTEQIWKTSEIRSIDHVLAGAPDQYSHLSGLKFFKRYADGVKDKDPGSSEDTAAWANFTRKEIVLLDGTFKNPELENAEPYIFHELSHHYEYDTLDKSAKIEFSKISGWDDGKDVKDKDNVVSTVYSHAEDAKFVREYAGKSPYDDFAESCAYYRYHPYDHHLSPEKYQFLKDKVFKGVEYSESRGWAALDQEISAKGGMSGMLRSCISKVTKIYSGDQDLTLVQNAPDIIIQTINTDAIGTTMYCMTNVEKQIADRLQKSDPAEFCARGGAVFVQRLLNESVEGDMIEFSEIANACLKEKKLKHDCSMAKKLQANAYFLRLTPSDQKVISQHFEDLVISAYNGVVHLFSNTDIVTPISKMVTVEARHSAYFRDILGKM